MHLAGPGPDCLSNDEGLSGWPPGIGTEARVQGTFSAVEWPVIPLPPGRLRGRGIFSVTRQLLFRSQHFLIFF
jgi:hypothetical protein